LTDGEAGGKAKYRQRFEKADGYKIVLSDIKQDKWLDFYAKYGSQKDQEALRNFLFPNGQLNEKINPAKLQVFNANAGNWLDLLDDAAYFDNLTDTERDELRARQTRDDKEQYLEKIGKTARLEVMRGNQTAGMASAFALSRIKEVLSFAQMDYATAVIWRYKGHWKGVYAYDGKDLSGNYDPADVQKAAETGTPVETIADDRKIYQVSTDYKSDDFNADRYKDGPIWQAVLDRDLELKGVSNSAERFLRIVLRRSAAGIFRGPILY